MFIIVGFRKVPTEKYPNAINYYVSGSNDYYKADSGEFTASVWCKEPISGLDLGSSCEIYFNKFFKQFTFYLPR